MKLIHCADIHLDSKMTANLDEKKAKERKQELLKTFQNMITYADENDIKGILIAGDLFDTKNVLKTTKNVILNEVKTHPNIIFYYLKGNHDVYNFLNDLEEVPENLKMFKEDWTSYDIGEQIRITGVEISDKNAATIYVSLVLDREKINIVLLHGQEVEHNHKDQTEAINLKALQNQGIDYLALGHIHAYKEEVLDVRGRYCYSGCLEGRGFDECGEHGFVVLDIDEKEKTVKSEFIPFASRMIYTVPLDVTGCMQSVEIVEKAKQVLKEGNYDDSSLIKLVLTGEIDVECEINLDYIKKQFESNYYVFKVKDETKLYVDIEQYAGDVSLKGEFIRLVKATQDIPEEEKNTIVHYGLKFLNGEGVIE